MCKICEQTIDISKNRDDLMSKKYLGDNIFINGDKMIVVEYNIGYYLIKQNIKINFCPECGKNLKQKEVS